MQLRPQRWLTRTKTSCTVRKRSKRKAQSAASSKKIVSHPNPDWFYSPTDVAATVSDEELLVHTTKVIRRQCQRQQQRCLASLRDTGGGPKSTKKKVRPVPSQLSGSDTDDDEKDAPPHCLVSKPFAKQILPSTQEAKATIIPVARKVIGK